MHGIHNMQPGKSRVGQLLLDHSPRDDSNDWSAGSQRRIGDDAHQAYMTGAVDEPQAARGQSPTQFPRGFAVEGGAPAAGAAEYA